MTTLSSISSLPPKDRLSAYQALLPGLYASPTPGLADLVAHLVTDPSVSLVVGRQVYSDVVDAFKEGRVGGGDVEVKRTVVERILERVGSGGGQAGNYEEQVSSLSL